MCPFRYCHELCNDFGVLGACQCRSASVFFASPLMEEVSPAYAVLSYRCATALKTREVSCYEPLIGANGHLRRGNITMWCEIPTILYVNSMNNFPCHWLVAFVPLQNRDTDIRFQNFTQLRHPSIPFWSRGPKLISTILQNRRPVQCSLMRGDWGSECLSLAP